MKSTEQMLRNPDIAPSSDVIAKALDTEFVLNFLAALMATAKYPAKPDVTELIVEIPPWWIADKVIVSELMEFLSLVITDKNRKTQNSGGGL